MSVKITKTDEVIQVESTYNEVFIRASKQIGGRWNPENRSWDFPLENEDLVMRELAEIYSYSIEDEKRVYVYINVDEWVEYRYDDSLMLGRLLVAKRVGRDEDVRLYNGAVVIQGGFADRGGSAKNPRLEPKEGTIIRIKILEWLADKIIKEAEMKKRDKALRKEEI